MWWSKEIAAFSPHLLLCLLFLVHDIDEISHPWFLAGMDDTQSSSTVGNEPEKADEIVKWDEANTGKPGTVVL